MLAFTLASLSLALTTFATPLKRGLTVGLKIPEARVSSITDIKVIATVANTGTEDLRILKYGSVLDTLPTRSFHVTKDGFEVAFIGITAEVDISQTTNEAYAIIPSGESVSVTHKVAELYDFASAGTGSFAFVPVRDFMVSNVKNPGNAVKSYSHIEAPAASAVTVNVIKDVAARGHEKRAVVTCTDPAKAKFINASYSEAKMLARTASNWIASNNASDLYKLFWKTNSPDTIRNNFDMMANENNPNRTMDCVDHIRHCQDHYSAYVFMSAPPRNIVLCDVFFKYVETNRLCSWSDIEDRDEDRGRVLLHELAHAVLGSQDIKYGFSESQTLSAANQARNADNYAVCDIELRRDSANFKPHSISLLKYTSISVTKVESLGEK